MGDGMSCVDVNECTNGTAECGKNSRCLKTRDYDCECLPGYKGDGFTCRKKKMPVPMEATIVIHMLIVSAKRTKKAKLVLHVIARMVNLWLWIPYAFTEFRFTQWWFM